MIQRFHTASFTFRLSRARSLVRASALMLLAFVAVDVPALAQGGGGGLLKITSYPTGAQVSIDGVATGKITPTSASVALGEHTVTVSVPGSGWNPDTRLVTVVSGNNDLSVTLLPVVTVGPQGPPGPAGPQGPQGLAGPAGPAGKVLLAVATPTDFEMVDNTTTLLDSPSRRVTINLTETSHLLVTWDDFRQAFRFGDFNSQCTYRLMVDGVPVGGPRAIGLASAGSYESTNVQYQHGTYTFFVASVAAGTHTVHVRLVLGGQGLCTFGGLAGLGATLLVEKYGS
jgi:hypothetical protein